MCDSPDQQPLTAVCLTLKHWDVGGWDEGGDSVGVCVFCGRRETILHSQTDNLFSLCLSVYPSVLVCHEGKTICPSWHDAGTHPSPEKKKERSRSFRLVVTRREGSDM